MSRKKRKKEPPNTRPSPFDSPLDTSSPIDLASYWLYSWFRLQPFHFPCSTFVYGFSAVPISSQVNFLSQPVVGFQRWICWSRLHRFSSTIPMELGLHPSSVCDELSGYHRGRPLASVMVPVFQFQEPRSTIVARRCQDWHIRSIRAFGSSVLRSILSGCCVCWIGLPRFFWPWNSLRLNWLSGVEVLDVIVIWFSSVLGLDAFVLCCSLARVWVRITLSVLACCSSCVQLLASDLLQIRLRIRAHLCLDSSIDRITVLVSFVADGVRVEPLSHLQWSLYFFKVQPRPVGPLLTDVKRCTFCGPQ